MYCSIPMSYSRPSIYEVSLLKTRSKSPSWYGKCKSKLMANRISTWKNSQIFYAKRWGCALALIVFILSMTNYLFVYNWYGVGTRTSIPTSTSTLAESVKNETSSGIIELNLNAKASEKIWTAKGINGNKTIQVSASVPGGIYTDLEYAGGIFPTPLYYRYNDQEVKWVGRTGWNFSREFVASDALLSKFNIVLICEGLDTVAKVYLNGMLVGSSDNMFVRYVFNIKDALKPGKNLILVQFESPVLYAEKQWKIQNETYPIGPECVPPEYHGECHANHIRKMQASFAWDWGPSYPSSGIWKNISIQGYDGAVVRDVMVFIHPDKTIPDETNETNWKITVKVWSDNSEFLSSWIKVNLTLREKSKNGTKNPLNSPIIATQTKLFNEGSSPHNFRFGLQGDRIKMWWPNGYGDQPLYELELSYKNSATPNEVSHRNITIGFRTIELIQENIFKNDSKKGLSFYFKVNGVPIYAKGSNFIPIHVLPERVTSEMTRWIFESSKLAHFNMIRVWGGGIYESEEFYKYADETGILIWQDFMFACSMYPTNPKFLTSVQKEIETQIKRLQHHPSIAIWAANNENEAALRGNWYQTSGNFSLYKQDYIKLYVETILRLVKELDPSRECLSSSPTNAKESEAEGWVAENPYSNLYGDVHFYDYRSDGWDWKEYPLTRFASEYGYQSWPSPETLLTGISKDKDWSWGSQMMSHRQHHPGGQQELENQVRKHLPVPENMNAPEAFESVLYMTQINHAMSVKSQTEFYRRLKGQLNTETGEGHNMGALYWQLNDIWQGASWAGIESTGRWKMLHYYAKNFFAPIIMSPFETRERNISVHLISDSVLPFNGTMCVRLFSLDNLKPKFDYNISVSAEPLSAKEVHVIPERRLEECKNSVEVCLLHFSMPGTPDNFLYLKYPTESSNIHDPKLKIKNVRKAHKKSNLEYRSTFDLTLETQTVTPFVFLSLKTNEILGHFCHNGFNMVEPHMNIRFTSMQNLSLAEFEEQLQVTSLFEKIVRDPVVEKTNMTTASPKK